MINIDKGVSVPTDGDKGGRQPTYPWRDMKPGDSFFVPTQNIDKRERASGFNLTMGKRAHPGSTWATRTVTENGIRGIRVWRLT